MRMLLVIMIAHAMTAVPIGLSAAQNGRGNYIITEAAGSEFRVFIGQNGKTVRGKVRDFNSRNETVTITKKNGSILKVNLGIFSKADQAYVREWYLIKEFYSQNRLRISAREKQKRFRTELLIWRTEEEIVYSIMLENRSDCDLNDLTMDYCIYHEVHRPDTYFEPYRPGNQEQVDSQNVKCGTLKIGTLAAGGKMHVETQPVVIPREGGGLEYYKGNRRRVGKTRGVWVRIYLPLSDKRYAMREYAMPNSIMKTRQWITPGAPSSQNNGQENKQKN